MSKQFTRTIRHEVVEAYDPYSDTYVEAFKDECDEVLPFNFHLKPEFRRQYSLV